MPIISLSAGSIADDDSTKWQNIETQIRLFGVPTLFLAGVILVLLALTWYLALLMPKRLAAFEVWVYPDADTID